VSSKRRIVINRQARALAPEAAWLALLLLLRLQQQHLRSQCILKFSMFARRYHSVHVESELHVELDCVIELDLTLPEEAHVN
jgi:hypothetical protein